MIDMELWHRVHGILYPGRSTNGVPFPRPVCSPRARPASWLYHTLAANPQLRATVLRVHEVHDRGREGSLQ